MENTHSVTQRLKCGGAEVVFPKVINAGRNHFRELLLRIWRGFTGADTLHEMLHSRVDHERYVVVSLRSTERYTVQKSAQGK
jgi:hypothetical protein